MCLRCEDGETFGTVGRCGLPSLYNSIQSQQMSVVVDQVLSQMHRTHIDHLHILICH